MTWWLESPWPAILSGIAVEVVLAIVLVRTGRGALLGAMGGVLAVAACLVILERVVVTEKEEVEDALEAIATSVEANDAQSVLAAFASSSPRRAEVQSALHRVKVSSARIAGDLEVRFNRLGAAPAATAYFTGIIDAKDKTGSIPYEHMMRRFKVTLHKEGDRWLVFDYEDNDRGQGQRGP